VRRECATTSASSRRFGCLRGANPSNGALDERGNLNYPFRLSINFYRLSLRQLSGSTTRSIRGGGERRISAPPRRNSALSRSIHSGRRAVADRTLIFYGTKRIADCNAARNARRPQRTYCDCQDGARVGIFPDRCRCSAGADRPACSRASPERIAFDSGGVRPRGAGRQLIHPIDSCDEGGISAGSLLDPIEQSVPRFRARSRRFGRK